MQRRHYPASEMFLRRTESAAAFAGVSVKKLCICKFSFFFKSCYLNFAVTIIEPGLPGLLLLCHSMF